MLDSLKRQAKLMEEAGNERTLGLETILEDHSSEDILQLSRIEPKVVVKGLKPRNLSKLPFAIMSVGGLTLLWIYARRSRSFSLERLTTVQQTISSAGFADWQKIGLMAQLRTHYCNPGSTIDREDTLTRNLDALSFVFAHSQRDRSTEINQMASRR